MNPICELLDTAYGPMLVPIHDINQTGALRATRVGPHHERMTALIGILEQRPPYRVMVDAGANIGCFTLGLAPYVGGMLHAFEAQPIIANMLAGSVALSQRTNIRVHNVCLGEHFTSTEIPQFDYTQPLNFGSVQFGPEQREVLTQERKHDPDRIELIQTRPLDSYWFERLDLLKIDVEGMEIELLRGAAGTLKRCKPVIFIEWIQSNPSALTAELAHHGYRIAGEYVDDWLCFPVDNG